MTAPNEQAAGRTTVTAPAEQAQREFASASTATEVQIERSAILLQRGSRHTHELRILGISHPAACVLDLQARGWSIAADRIATIDSDGYQHSRVALYTVISAPDATWVPPQLANRTGDLIAQLEGATS
jgi:hypothetical protein